MTSNAVVVRFVGEDQVTPVTKQIQGSVNELGGTADKAGSKFDALGKIAEPGRSVSGCDCMSYRRTNYK